MKRPSLKQGWSMPIGAQWYQGRLLLWSAAVFAPPPPSGRHFSTSTVVVLVGASSFLPADWYCLPRLGTAFCGCKRRQVVRCSAGGGGGGGGAVSGQVEERSRVGYVLCTCGCVGCPIMWLSLGMRPASLPWTVPAGKRIGCSSDDCHKDPKQTTTIELP